MLEVLASGKLIKDPDTRTGQSGKPFTTALLRVDVGEEQPTLVSVIAFQEASEKLGRLKSGDAITVAGSAKLSSWEKDGETRHGLSVTASAVLSVYDVKRRRGNEERSEAMPPKPAGEPPEPDLDDPIPF